MAAQHRPTDEDRHRAIDIALSGLARGRPRCHRRPTRATPSALTPPSPASSSSISPPTPLASPAPAVNLHWSSKPSVSAICQTGSLTPGPTPQEQVRAPCCGDDARRSRPRPPRRAAVVGGPDELWYWSTRQPLAAYARDRSRSHVAGTGASIGALPRFAQPRGSRQHAVLRSRCQTTVRRSRSLMSQSATTTALDENRDAVRHRRSGPNAVTRCRVRCATIGARGPRSSAATQQSSPRVTGRSAVRSLPVPFGSKPYRPVSICARIRRSRTWRIVIIPDARRHPGAARSVPRRAVG